MGAIEGGGAGIFINTYISPFQNGVAHLYCGLENLMRRLLKIPTLTQETSDSPLLLYHIPIKGAL